ncbi:hypothetical protein P305_04585 [Xylella fastidiosa subsp. fastidiosa Mus-1]|nr:hypothetical protein P305_04585 [Xylella fastidiosa subsp. fastidiosa Mus-1]
MAVEVPIGISGLQGACWRTFSIVGVVVLLWLHGGG